MTTKLLSFPEWQDTLRKAKKAQAYWRIHFQTFDEELRRAMEVEAGIKIESGGVRRVCSLEAAKRPS